MTSYTVIGAGGVGGFYGIGLVRAGAEVHFLIRSAPDPGAALTLVSGDREYRVRPGLDCAVHTGWSGMPRTDVVLVAVKATANEDVLPRIAGLVKPGGAVLLLQNGIGAEPAYAAALPGDVELAGGLAFLASHRESPNRFVHVDYGALTLGRYAHRYAPAGAGPWMRRAAQDLGRAEVPVVLSEDLLAARWQKLVWNIPFNGLSVLLQARTDELMASPPARALIEALMQEVLAAAAADGRPLAADLIGSMMAMTSAMRPYEPSMKLDHDAGRPMEVDALYTAAVARAASAGGAMPLTQALGAALAFLDARGDHRRSAAGSPAAMPDSAPAATSSTVSAGPGEE